MIIFCAVSISNFSSKQPSLTADSNSNPAKLSQYRVCSRSRRDGCMAAKASEDIRLSTNAGSQADQTNTKGGCRGLLHYDGRPVDASYLNAAEHDRVVHLHTILSSNLPRSSGLPPEVCSCKRSAYRPTWHKTAEKTRWRRHTRPSAKALTDTRI